ncbi:hypothetical protein LJ655_13205 [Paraburkholderia sp. MMS20-SJTN17]|uniref:Glycosyltransferase RgtA/B/C/D-like domain-containing protein n=1 Tax=Paraburkholderia translucens TaxID=2886945 RepID=A0ABS8KDJ1_9BURK|nr:hypothetical protein [Paraburkholderia sp. MMS20-SJTN17]MCC8402832.1 hypothetical protein [Paraburkholderia sp. MMS20-SJTN17]
MSTTIKFTTQRMNWTQLGDQVVVFVFASSLYGAILYNFGIRSGVVAGISAFAIVLAVVIYGYISHAQRLTTIVSILLIAVVLICFGYLREFSYDGLNYHVATPLRLDHSLNGDLSSHELGGAFWAAHYPKAFEYFAYTTTVLTSHFNSGKSFTLLLSVPACLALMRLLQSAGISARAALVASATCIYNPVALGQLTTFYVDAGHYYCWTIFSVNLLFALKGRPYSAVQLCIALVLLIGSKLTGPIFAAISILVFFVATFISGEKRNFFRNHKGLIGQLTISTFVAAAVIGYSPYVENFIAGKHILYPILGKDRIDLVAEKTYPHFFGMTPLHRLFLSYFSVPMNCSSCTMEPVFMPSLAHLRDAFIALHTADTRFAGFGPFFGAMLIASLASFFWRKKGADAVVNIFLLATLVIVVSHPQSWWARYVPMFYVVPFLVVAGFSTNRRLFHVVVAFGIANSVLAAASVMGYLVLKEAHYEEAVASVRTTCKQDPIVLSPSKMNWEADLRDDHLVIAAEGTPANAGCPVDFDQMMVMKK